MAQGAKGANVGAGQLESGVIVVEGGRLPGCRRMAGFTGSAFGGLMHIIGGMTAKTSGGGVIKFGCGEMTLGTSHAGMRTHQGKDRAVIEGGWLPGSGGMTIRAGGTLTISMHIILQMAAHTSQRRTLEDTIDMAGAAGNGCVRTSQLEGRQIVVKGGRQPGSCTVTGAAACSKRTSVMIILLMTGKTGGRSTLEFTGCSVAIGTQHADVRTGELEGRIGMVESGWLPNSGGMAGFASSTLRAAMHIFSAVAAHAGHRCIIELGRCKMTLCAGQAYMRAYQCEDGVVIERGRFPDCGGMTGLASRALRTNMHIFRQVASHAGHGCTLKFTGYGVTFGAQHSDMRAS